MRCDVSGPVWIDYAHTKSTLLAFIPISKMTQELVHRGVIRTLVRKFLDNCCIANILLMIELSNTHNVWSYTTQIVVFVPRWIKLIKTKYVTVVLDWVIKEILVKRYQREQIRKTLIQNSITIIINIKKIDRPLQDVMSVLTFGWIVFKALVSVSCNGKARLMPP